MTENASIALKEAETKLNQLAALNGIHRSKIELVGGVVLSIVAAILHQWEAQRVPRA